MLFHFFISFFFLIQCQNRILLCLPFFFFFTFSFIFLNTNVQRNWLLPTTFSLQFISLEPYIEKFSHSYFFHFYPISSTISNTPLVLRLGREHCFSFKCSGSLGNLWKERLTFRFKGFIKLYVQFGWLFRLKWCSSYASITFMWTYISCNLN